MTQDALTTFFGWMTLINMGIYTFSALLIFAIRDWIVSFQARLFGMDPADIRRVVYAWLGAYKLAITVFCLVPWIALCLMS
ncbi:MAG: hypothetical protein CML68_19735 [Rhodobacteraceae bacterium]|nr:hypothetical protein [Paracoccaceae bacterium]